MKRRMPIDFDQSDEMSWDNYELDRQSGIIKYIAEMRGVNHVVHFSHIDNMENIIRYGLMNRIQIDRRKIASVYSDSNRFDGKLSTISLSVSCCNFSMLGKKIKEFGSYFCIIFLRPEVLWEKQCAFYPHNAASKEYIHQDVKKFRGGGDLVIFLPMSSRLS